MTSSDYANRKDKSYQNRYNMVRGLAWAWINEHRPDVAKQIQFEAEKVFPKPSTGIMDLPVSLQKMK